MAISLQAKSDAPSFDAMSEVLQVLHTAADPRVYVRDEIVVDESFVKRVQAIATGFAKGTTLKLAARTIRHDPGVVLRLEGYPLVIAADSYDGNGGAILSAPPRRSIVAATVDASLPAPIGDQKFWGRSPTALWRLTIDPSETAVNLDGLTEIQLVVDYKCAEGGRRANAA